jgi:3-(3-hydroxy-phenyl)propionate hydroxylase
VPAVKRYVVEMRFKPMPRYERGAVTYTRAGAGSPVGTQFIQPRVDTRTARGVPLDDVLGPWFSVLCWNNDPRTVLGDEAERWVGLGARLVSLRPASQLHWPDHDHPDVEVVGDGTGALKRWFDAQQCSVLFLRPDRFVAGACVAQVAPEVSHALVPALSLTSHPVVTV